ncbi:putative membrane protein [Flavobacterium sp. 270]|nr:putative membrane protein [Flavobacterium sp. 270]
MEKSKVMQNEKFGEKDFQTIIGNLLRYGVWTSLSVAFIGGIVYLIHNGSQIEDYSVFKENDRNIFEVISTVYNGVIQGNGEYLIFFGIILLFLTPVFRVLLSLFSFLLEKDYLYVVITTIVILIIITSISFGFSH